MFNYSKGRCKICIWWFHFCCFNFSGGGDDGGKLGSQWPQPATPALLGQQSQEPSSSCGQGFSKQQHLLPGKGNRPWITSEPPLSHGAGGLSGMLCPCPSLPLRGCECPSPNPSAGSLCLPVLPLLSAAIRRVHSQISELEIHSPQATQKDDPKGCTWGFKDEHQDAALAKTCLMFNTAAFLWIFS